MSAATAVGPFDAILAHMYSETKPMFTQVINTINIRFLQGGVTYAQLELALTAVQVYMEKVFEIKSYLHHVTD
jgi:hypothetical protein